MVLKEQPDRMAPKALLIVACVNVETEALDKRIEVQSANSICWLLGH